jgi:hypothetical protein
MLVASLHKGKEIGAIPRASGFDHTARGVANRA